MTLKEKLLELIGDEKVAGDVETALGEFMVSKTAYGDLNKKYKTALEEKKVVDEQLETLKGTQMTAEEKIAAAEKKALEKEAEFNRKINRLSAEKKLNEAGLAETDYADFIDDIISEDADKTTKLVENLSGMLKKQKEAIEKVTKEELLKITPKPGTLTQNPPPKESEAAAFARERATAQKSANDSAAEAAKLYFGE